MVSFILSLLFHVHQAGLYPCFQVIVLIISVAYYFPRSLINHCPQAQNMVSGRYPRTQSFRTGFCLAELSGAEYDWCSLTVTADLAKWLFPCVLWHYGEDHCKARSMTVLFSRDQLTHKIQ